MKMNRGCWTFAHCAANFGSRIISRMRSFVAALTLISVVSAGCNERKGYGIALMNRSHQALNEVAILSGDDSADRLRASAAHMAPGAFMSFSITGPLAKHSDVQWAEQGGTAHQMSVNTDVP